MTTHEKDLRFTIDMNELRIEGLENMIRRADPFSDDVDRAIVEIRRLRDVNFSIWRELYTTGGREFQDKMDNDTMID